MSPFKWRGGPSDLHQFAGFLLLAGCLAYATVQIWPMPQVAGLLKLTLVVSGAACLGLAWPGWQSRELVVDPERAELRYRTHGFRTRRVPISEVEGVEALSGGFGVRLLSGEVLTLGGVDGERLAAALGAVPTVPEAGPEPD